MPEASALLPLTFSSAPVVPAAPLPLIVTVAPVAT